MLVERNVLKKALSLMDKSEKLWVTVEGNKIQLESFFKEPLVVITIEGKGGNECGGSVLLDKEQLLLALNKSRGKIVKITLEGPRHVNLLTKQCQINPPACLVIDGQKIKQPSPQH